ncbi:MAG: butyrate kinase [Desulfovibrio sp.]
MRILAINPGGTSTKIAVFDDRRELLNINIQHGPEEMHGCASVFDQLGFRKAAVLDALSKAGIGLEKLDAVVGRGGLLKSVPGGTYAVNNAMVDDLRRAINGEHPSNLGPVMARDIADSRNIPAFIVDPVSVDEFDARSRLSGISEIERPSWLHALNHKAVCREVAERMGGQYEDFNFIVAHLGSGISIAAHRRGRMVDGSGGRSNGPFSPERCGSLPAYPLVELCYSGRFTHAEMVSKISTRAGMYDYLGTKDMLEIEGRYRAGDERAVLVLDAFVYQTAKDVAKYGATLCGEVDRIIVTGGIARSECIVGMIAAQVGWIAPLEIVPGEREMEALAAGVLRVLTGVEEAKLY